MRNSRRFACLVACAGMIGIGAPNPIDAMQPEVLMVVKSPGSLNSGEAAIHARLDPDYDVVVIDDNDLEPGDADGSAFVLVSSSVSTSALPAGLRDVDRPIWVAKPWYLDDMGMTGPTSGADYGNVRSASVTIAAPGHPMAAGQTGDVAFTTSARSISYGEPGGDGVVVTTANGRSSAIVYESGDQLADGTAARACRVHSSLFQSAPAGFTSAAWQMFDATADYLAAGCDDVTPPDPSTRVIAISADGMRPDTVANLGAAELPNLHRLIQEGAATGDARTDVDLSRTLPNHTSMVTGAPVLGPNGHGVTFNEDDGNTVHTTAGRYVASMFDIAHDNGLSTAMYAGKPKFDFLDRSWDATNGAPDITGADDGTDKIDIYERAGGTATTASVVAALGGSPSDLTFVHFAAPDAAGHDFGWESAEYEDALREVDGFVGQILAAIDGNPALDGDTVVIMTADHGGTGLSHGDNTLLINVRIPFWVWGGDVTGPVDLYTLNPGTRADPGDTIPSYAADPQPVRTGDVANLALDLLGLSSVPGSTINAAQDLDVTGAPPADAAPSVSITAPADGAAVGGSIEMQAAATDDNGVVSVSFTIDGGAPLVDNDGADGWSVSWDSTAGADGPAQIVATATDTIGQTATDSIDVTVANATPTEVVVVVGNAGGLSGPENAVVARLDSLGHDVTLVDDDAATAGDAGGAVFVFLSYTVSTNKIGDMFESSSTPVWVAKPWLLDDYGMTGTSGGTDYGTNSTKFVTITEPTHPIAAGLIGDVDVFDQKRTISYGVPGGNGTTVAVDDGGLPYAFAYDAGDTLADGTTAAGCRIHVSTYGYPVTRLTSEGWALFDAAAAYAAAGCT